MLFDAPLDAGRPPVTARPPSEDEPQPVASWPGWVWWPGVNGLVYARRPRWSPSPTVRARTFTALLAEIRAAEAARRAG